eukprot:COSAG06_NODE_13453_length_1255_cov_2.661765_1_plen_36_part_10
MIIIKNITAVQACCENDFRQYARSPALLDQLKLYSI